MAPQLSLLFLLSECHSVNLPTGNVINKKAAVTLELNGGYDYVK